MWTIDHGKVTQLRDRIASSYPSAFPLIFSTHLAMLILHPLCVSATHHLKYDKLFTVNSNA